MFGVTEYIEKLGFDKWFLRDVDPERLAGLEIVRVVSVHKDSYIITNGRKDIFAELAGRLAYSADSQMDYPAVGDWVLADPQEALDGADFGFLSGRDVVGVVMQDGMPEFWAGFTELYIYLPGRGYRRVTKENASRFYAKSSANGVPLE